MRRIWATVLLLVFSFSLTTPLLLASPDSGIAPCCRRDGKHHCAKMASSANAGSSDGLVRVTAAMTCPLFNGGKGSPAVAQTAIVPPADLTFFTPTLRIAKAPQAEAQGRISKSRASQKRGPPALLA